VTLRNQNEEKDMQTYMIRRRNGWKTHAELEQAAAVSKRIGNEMTGEVRWIRSYVVQEEDGQLGTLCIYQGISPDAIRDHARRAGMPADEVLPVAGTVIVRADPETSAAA
jgi:hypothetical protein